MWSMEGKGDKSVFPNGLPSCLLSPSTSGVVFFPQTPNMACFPHKNKKILFRALHLFVLHVFVH